MVISKNLRSRKNNLIPLKFRIPRSTTQYTFDNTLLPIIFAELIFAELSFAELSFAILEIFARNSLVID